MITYERARELTNSAPNVWRDSGAAIATGFTMAISNLGDIDPEAEAVMLTNDYETIAQAMVMFDDLENE